MSARALEFVETWVSEKIGEMKKLPAEGDEAAAKALANECFQAALDEDIPAASGLSTAISVCASRRAIIIQINMYGYR